MNPTLSAIMPKLNSRTPQSFVLLILLIFSTFGCGMGSVYVAAYLYRDNGIGCRLNNPILLGAHLGFLVEFFVAALIFYVVHRASKRKFPNFRFVLIALFITYVLGSYIFGSMMYPWIGENAMRCEYNFDTQGVRIKQLVESHTRENGHFSDKDLFKNTLRECENRRGRIASLSELTKLIPGEIRSQENPIMTLENAGKTPMPFKWNGSTMTKFENAGLWTTTYCIVP